MYIRNILHKCGGLRYNPALVRQLTTANQQPQHLKQQLIMLQLNPATAVMTVKFNNPPANVLSLEFMQQIKATLEQLETSKLRGLILTCENNRIFCAGLDLNEIYQPKEQHLVEFWSALQDMWKVLFSMPIPTVALINGHAPAGGCLIACCCDYRVMMPHFKIGLNETRVGLPVPKWLMDTYVNVMPCRRAAEADMVAGKMYDSEDAATAGLVDALAHTHRDALHMCTQFLDTFKKVEHTASARTKLLFREDILKAFEQNRQKDLEMFVEGIQRPEVQAFLGAYLNKLKEKPKRWGPD